MQESEALLRAALAARDEALAEVSHDMRNFLQMIRSAMRLLGKPPDKLAAEVRHSLHARNITKSIVEAHHMHVWIDSVVGCGTSVFFTLPCIEALAAPPRQC